MGNKKLALLIGVMWLKGYLLAQSGIPQVAHGQINRYPNFSSQHVMPRNIDVWLPDNYYRGEALPVLYMHDGQMLFDSTNTWNKQEWGVDETMGNLMKQKLIRRCVVVGIWNTNLRRREYFPDKVFSQIPHPLKDSIQLDIGGEPQSSKYLQFIVQELKPFIDSIYHPLTDAENTFIAGSSMGGLISLYAICEYPNVFGGAACLSTHWPGSVYRNTTEVPDLFIQYTAAHLPADAKHRFYFDRGTATLDAWYTYGHNSMNALASSLKLKKYQSFVFEGADHTEKAWRQRLEIPMQFLLGK